MVELARAGCARRFAPARRPRSAGAGFAGVALRRRGRLRAADASAGKLLILLLIGDRRVLPTPAPISPAARSAGRRSRRGSARRRPGPGWSAGWSQRRCVFALAIGAIVYLVAGIGDAAPICSGSTVLARSRDCRPALGAGLAIAAQVGDFFESWLKRRAGVKDCSQSHPGTWRRVRPGRRAASGGAHRRHRWRVGWTLTMAQSYTLDSRGDRLDRCLHARPDPARARRLARGRADRQQQGAPNWRALAREFGAEAGRRRRREPACPSCARRWRAAASRRAGGAAGLIEAAARRRRPDHGGDRRLRRARADHGGDRAGRHGRARQQGSAGFGRRGDDRGGRAARRDAAAGRFRAQRDLPVPRRQRSRPMSARSP